MNTGDEPKDDQAKVVLIYLAGLSFAALYYRQMKEGQNRVGQLTTDCQNPSKISENGLVDWVIIRHWHRHYLLNIREWVSQPGGQPIIPNIQIVCQSTGRSTDSLLTSGCLGFNSLLSLQHELKTLFSRFLTLSLQSKHQLVDI